MNLLWVVLRGEIVNEPGLTFEKRDEFNRAKTAKNIVDLVKSGGDFFPMLLEGPWGVGKSEFCLKLIPMLEGEKVETAYLDAFKFDHTDLVLPAIISVIIKKIPKESRSALVKRSLPVIKTLSKIGVKALLTHVAKQNADSIIGEIGQAAGGSVDSLVDHGIKTIIDDFQEADDVVRAFQEKLGEHLSKSSPMVLIIDELDRCRPNFALEVIEKVKHIFSIDGLKIIVVTNFPQMMSMVEQTYGANIDSKIYLEKFFSTSIRLSESQPLPQRDRHNTSILLEQKFEKLDCFGSRFAQGTDFHILEEIFERQGQSLRSVESFCKSIEVYNVIADTHQKLSKNTIWSVKLFRLLGIYLHTFNPTIASKLLTKTLTVEEILEFFHEPQATMNKPVEGKSLRLLAAYLISHFAPQSDRNKVINERKGAEWMKVFRSVFHSGLGADVSEERLLQVLPETVANMNLFSISLN
jgi:hypothetical protein